MIPNSILVTNGKGGVGKSSLVANLCAVAAAGGWRVLAVDIDPQGNLARDLGVLEPSDSGRNLREAALARELLHPLQDVRPNLDLAPGGEELEALLGDIQAAYARGQYLTAMGVLERALAPVAASYDLVVVDSPPGERALQTAATRAAHFIVIPTCPDECSIDGLGAVFDLYYRMRSEGANPQLTILGVALCLVGSRATSIADTARATLKDLLGEKVPLFAQPIRFAQAAATGCRRKGITAAEYAAAADATAPWYRDKSAERLSNTGTGLAADYQALSHEILTAYTLASELGDGRNAAWSR